MHLCFVRVSPLQGKNASISDNDYAHSCQTLERSPDSVEEKNNRRQTRFDK